MREIDQISESSSNELIEFISQLEPNDPAKAGKEIWEYALSRLIFRENADIKFIF